MMGRKINKRFIAALSVLITFSVASCASTGKMVDFTAIQNWTKVALIEVMITPPESPVVPLLQSAIYRTGLNKLSPDITNLHQERIDKIAETLGDQLGENLGFSVLHGRQLLKHDVFKNIEDAGIKTYPTTLKNESFKSLAIPSRGYNFFNFSESDKDPNSLFNGESNLFLEQHANSIAAVCSVLGVDSVAVASFTVETTAVNFLAQGSKRLVVTLTFFDRSGKVFYYNTASTDNENSGGGDIEAYKNVLDKYPDVIKTLKTRMVGVKKAAVP